MKSSARILMLLDSEFPLDERVEKEAISLLEEGHKVFLMCYTYNVDLRVDEIYKGIEIHRIHINKKTKQKTDPFIASVPWLISRMWMNPVSAFIQQNGITHLHVHDLPLCSVGSKLARKFGINFIADMHENYPALVSSKDYRSKLIGRIFVRLKAWYSKEVKWLQDANAIIVTAPGMKKRLESRGITEPSYYLLENTIKRADYNFVHFKPDKEYITLFYSGGINEHRGLQYVIKALAELTTERTVRFWIVGAGKYERNLKQYSQSLQLENVHFLGWKTVQEMFELMTRSDICLIPHKKSEHTDNTSPNKLFHYFYAGKPVLVSNCAYLKSVVEETETGLVYRYDDPQDLARKLDSLIMDLSLPKWSSNARAAVEEKYNWEKSAKALVELYS